MNITTTNLKIEPTKTLYHGSRSGYETLTLSKIYEEEVNIAIWKRNLDNSLISAAKHILEANPKLQLSKVVQPKNVYEILTRELGLNENTTKLYKDISELVDMFCAF